MTSETLTRSDVRRAPVAYAGEVRLMWNAAMVMFIYTVVIGILNGVDAVEFERKALMAHLHVGTLGWITMAVFAGSLMLFGVAGREHQGVRWLARLSIVAAVLYNVAFLTTTGILRPVLGTLMLLVILAFTAWGIARARVTSLSVVHLGMLAGLVTSVLGAVLGVLLGVMLASPDVAISSGVGDAHPATMVVGFLVPVGMALVEWVLRPGSVHEPATRAGQLQILLPFLGGVVLLVGFLVDVDALIALNLPLELVGVGIFVWRIAPMARAVSLTGRGVARFGVPAAVFLLVNIAILVYLIANYIEDFDEAPRRLMLALDHSIFLGVLTAGIIALIAMTSDVERPAWVDHSVFVGLNVGVAGFVLGLLADATPMLQVFTPVMGAAILLAIGTHLRGMFVRRSAPAS
jgi:hypothetical protein